MKTACIYNIDITTNNNDIISLSSDSFNNFYIANIDDNGEETAYIAGTSNSDLFANFFMIKILKEEEPDIIAKYKRLLNKKDIIRVGLSFTNGYYQQFDLAKKRIASDGTLINKYEETFLDEDNNLCIIVSDKDIKYKKELFA